MKILITGKNGQLGHELQKTFPADLECLACNRDELDITSVENINSVVSEFRPDIFINTAAYTAVDKAEEEQDLAFQVNAESVQNIISVIRPAGVKLVHVSTDFVFSGDSSSPYTPDAPTAPVGVYARSKAAGENILRNEYPDNSIIIRTSWLYSSHGNNFVKTMLRLMGERDSLSVVSDQAGTPTWAGELAKAIWSFCKLNIPGGIFHWSDAGVASWYDFAVAIQEEALQMGLLERAIEIIPIRTADYPTPAKRPSYSVLDKQSTWDIIGFRSPHWRVSLRNMLMELKNKS